MRIIKFSALLLLLSLCFNMSSAFAGGGIGSFWSINDRPVTIILSYFDLRDRETMVQVTNTSSIDPATIHVQIFADAFNCEDRDFFDSLTPNETHVYDIRNLVRATGVPVNFQIPDGSHGFVIISASDGTMAQPLIIGNFRIIDDSGYEYRVNSAGSSEGAIPGTFELGGRFTDNWGANLSDIVGVSVSIEADLPDGTFDLTVQITDPYEVAMFDDEETSLSCGQAEFGCDEINVSTVDSINQGINDIFPNSRGGDVLCAGDMNTDGYIRLNPLGFPLADFVGFIGLNDGAGRGSMDRFRFLNLMALLVPLPPPM